MKDEVLVYDTSAVARFSGLFDIATQQECANEFGKPVLDKETGKIFAPNKNRRGK